MLCSYFTFVLSDIRSKRKLKRIMNIQFRSERASIRNWN
jgi:hypothetical protein